MNFAFQILIIKSCETEQNTQHNIKMCNPETINIHTARDSCMTQFRNNAISLFSVVFRIRNEIPSSATSVHLIVIINIRRGFANVSDGKIRENSMKLIAKFR